MFDTRKEAQYKEAVEYWYPETINVNSNALIVLVEVAIDEKIPQTFAEEHNILYRTVSYDEYINIEELFQEVVDLIYKKDFGEDKAIFYITDCSKNKKHVHKKQCV